MDTWTDKATGLTWQVQPPKVMPHAQATAYAESLELAGGGWRLPTKEELSGVSGENRPKELQVDGWFWSSSSVVASDNNAWTVYSVNGNVDNNGVYPDLHVRCVR